MDRGGEAADRTLAPEHVGDGGAIRLECGETLADGQLFLQQYLELPFEGYQWHDFSEFDVKTEKFWSGVFPEGPLSEIRKTFIVVADNRPDAGHEEGVP